MLVAGAAAAAYDRELARKPFGEPVTRLASEVLVRGREAKLHAVGS
jgi:hypothetical protein